MARPRPEKQLEKKLPVPTEQRVLPMQLQVGDRLTDETGEYEIIGCTSPAAVSTACCGRPRTDVWTARAMYAGTGGRPPLDRRRSDYLLSGIAKCADCGGPLVAFTRDMKGGERRNLYGCCTTTSAAQRSATTLS